MKVTLREFVENFVTPNTLCRLWIPYTGEERGIKRELALGESYSQTFMNWELLKGEVPQSKYLDCTFDGVTDIRNSYSPEALNLCVYADNVKEELYKPKKDDVTPSGCIGN